MKRYTIIIMLILALLMLLGPVAMAEIEPDDTKKLDVQHQGMNKIHAPADEATGCVDPDNPTGPGQEIDLDYAANPDPWAGVIYVNIPQETSDQTPTFCTDIETGIAGGDCFRTDPDNPLTACPITWLLNNGYGPSSSLSNAEGAARQAAVWYFSDGVNVLAGDPIYDRTQEIITAVPDPCTLPSEPPTMTIDPPSAVNFLPGGEEHPLTITVTQDGEPVEGQLVNLSTDFGTLSDTDVTTDSNGQAEFTVDSSSTGSATITASFSYELPSGTRFTKLPGADDQQVIVLGASSTGDVIAEATKTWEEGTTVVAHKFSDNNTNGVQDGGEENLSGWEMTLEKYNEGSGEWETYDSATTDSSGNVVFDNLPEGTYRVEETEQDGWYATTLNPSDSVTLAVGDQAVIEFGNVALAVIKAYKFNDLDGDGLKSEDEPLLDNWTINIDPAINGIGDGKTNNGSVSFFDLPPDTYLVWESQQPGWCPTTEPNLEVTVAANDFEEVWFGNQVCVDWGDLPDSFDTTSAQTGPSHILTSDLYLGACVDGEGDGVPSANATGDDVAAGVLVEGTCIDDDDEDGVTLVTPLIPGAEACVEIDAVNTGAASTLYGWLDFNGDGDFEDDADEYIMFTSGGTVANGGATDQQACFTVPADATFDGGETHMRFRLTTETLTATDWGGEVADGEVEDYWHPLACVGNYVWDDTNGSTLNVQDLSSDVAISGVDVRMVWSGPDGIIDTAASDSAAQNDDILFTDTTDSNGRYDFCGLTPDTYRIQIPTPPAATNEAVVPNQGGDVMLDSDGTQGVGPGLPVEGPDFTIPNPPTTLPTSEYGNEDNPGTLNNYPDKQDDLTIDFGFQVCMGSVIHATICQDTDRNKLCDGTNTPLVNIPVTLIPQGSTPGPIRMQVSNADGQVEFNQEDAAEEFATPGDYLMQIHYPYLAAQGLFPTEDSQFYFFIDDCDTVQHDFGYAPDELGVVGDLVWYDRDAEGDQDEWWDANDNNVITENTSDANGNIPFDLFEWFDINEDGNHDGPDDEGELRKCGISNVTVDNNYPDPPDAGETTTGIFGYYRFRPLPLDRTYTTSFDPADPELIAGAEEIFNSGLCKTQGAPPPEPGARLTGSKDSGTGPQQDLDCDITTVTSWTSKTLTAGWPNNTDLTLDYGIRCLNAEQVAIGNIVWNDNDENSIMDNGEGGLNGIGVRLFQDSNGNGVCEPESDSQVGSDTTTANGGIYQFLDLAPSTAGSANTYYCVGVSIEDLKKYGFDRSSTGGDHNPDTTGDHDVTSGDDGVPKGAWIVSRPFAATVNGQSTPDSGNPDTYPDASSYMTVDFGVFSGGATAVELTSISVTRSISTLVLLLAGVLALIGLTVGFAWMVQRRQFLS